MATHRSPDGRSIRTATAHCYHLPPCWCAWCECGSKLTAHAFEEADAHREALDVLGRDDDDDRPGFTHRRCSAGSRLGAC